MTTKPNAERKAQDHLQTFEAGEATTPEEVLLPMDRDSSPWTELFQDETASAEHGSQRAEADAQAARATHDALATIYGE